MCIYGITVLGLFGTCNESKWREELLTKLDNEITYFNPVVDDWNEEAQANEDKHKKSDTFILLTLTPEMKGFYTIAEIIEMAYTNPCRVIFCHLDEYGGKKFDEAQIRSLKKIIKDIEAVGVTHIYDNLDDVADFVNTYSRVMYNYRYDIKDVSDK
jgi:hypothetical protein